jgi:hypothetical protein
MKFSRVEIFASPKLPQKVAGRDELLIWFQGEQVWLTLGGQTDSWALWEKGTSIAESIEEHLR